MPQPDSPEGLAPLHPEFMDLDIQIVGYVRDIAELNPDLYGLTLYLARSGRDPLEIIRTLSAIYTRELSLRFPPLEHEPGVTITSKYDRIVDVASRIMVRFGEWYTR